MAQLNSLQDNSIYRLYTHFSRNFNKIIKYYLYPLHTPPWNSAKYGSAILHIKKTTIKLCITMNKTRVHVSSKTLPKRSVERKEAIKLLTKHRLRDACYTQRWNAKHCTCSFKYYLDSFLVKYLFNPVIQTESASLKNWNNVLTDTVDTESSSSSCSFIWQIRRWGGSMELRSLRP